MNTTTKQHIAKVVCVLDGDTQEEALYIDGELVTADSTIYCGMLAGYLYGCPCTIEQMIIVNTDFDKWPKRLYRLNKYRES